MLAWARLRRTNFSSNPLRPGLCRGKLWLGRGAKGVSPKGGKVREKDSKGAGGNKARVREKILVDFFFFGEESVKWR